MSTEGIHIDFPRVSTLAIELEIASTGASKNKKLTFYYKKWCVSINSGAFVPRKNAMGDHRRPKRQFFQKYQFYLEIEISYLENPM